jgi:hypothetical protein
MPEKPGDSRRASVEIRTNAHSNDSMVVFVTNDFVAFPSYAWLSWQRVPHQLSRDVDRGWQV